MRYFIVNYLTRPNGKMDEQVSIAKKVKNRDWSTASVILDFKTQRVEKSHLNGVTIPRDFQKIKDYYSQYYGNLIKDLEALYANPDPADVTDKDAVSR